MYNTNSTEGTRQKYKKNSKCKILKNKQCRIQKCKIQKCNLKNKSCKTNYRK